MNILYSSVTYYSDSENVEFVLTFDEYVPGEYFGIWGGEPITAPNPPLNTGFSITPTGQENELGLTTLAYRPFSSEWQYAFSTISTENELSFSLPFEDLGLESMPFMYEVSTSSMAYVGQSSLDTPKVYAAEPSGISSIVFGLVCLFWIIWRKRQHAD